MLFVLSSTAEAQIPSVAIGKIIRHADFASSYVTARHIDVWLPDGYETGDNNYPVLYMHDGQMLFDSTNTWNHQEWKMDETAGQLIKEGKIRSFIIVGIWNGGDTRHADYFPQKPFESMSEADKDIVYKAIRQNGAEVFKGKNICSDNYLKFITEELKPFIDKTYRTRSNRKNTFIAGSSMGGLISMYAICEYPDVFGGAACISTHWPGIFQLENNPVPKAFFSYLRNHLPPSRTHKFYFDHGTATLDAMYPSSQSEVNKIFKEKGYDKKQFMSLAFNGADHSEASWSKRMHYPLIFLLKTQRK
ncbi:MAG: alpha/beta hydrolase [Bacteroidota bacterium]|jgi:predicted alpha/beta superfamily hydrolase